MTATVGTYTLTIKLEDSHNASKSYEITFIVKDNAPPAFDSDPTSPIEVVKTQTL